MQRSIVSTLEKEKKVCSTIKSPPSTRIPSPFADYMQCTLQNRDAYSFSLHPSDDFHTSNIEIVLAGGSVTLSKSEVSSYLLNEHHLLTRQQLVKGQMATDRTKGCGRSACLYG